MNIRLSQLIAPSFYELHKRIKRGEQLKEVWLKGGRGSTKSSFVSLQIVLGLKQNPGANAIVFRRYDNELRDTVYGQMQWAVGKLGVEHEWRFMVSPMQAVYLPTGQKVLFKGADNPLKVKSFNLGTGYTKFVWFEEVDQFGGMEEIRNLLQSLLRGENHNRIVFFSYNPPRSARSWVNQETKIKREGRIVHHSDYRSVPEEWLGERFLVDARHLEEVNPTAYRHEYLGEEVGTGLEIFSNVVVEAVDESGFDSFRQGLDWGYAVDPVAFGRMHYDRKKRRLYIFEEISGIGVTNRQLNDMAKTHHRRELTTADSAEPKSIAEMRDDYGWNIRGAKKGPGSVEHGIKWLQDLEAIVIDPKRCPLAAKEFTNYALELRRDGEVISKYPDKDNHCVTGETVVLTRSGYKRIQDMAAADVVATRAGWRPSTAAFLSRKKEPVFRLQLVTGEWIEATHDHKVATERGWVSIDEIRYGDVVYSVRSNTWLNRKLLSSMGFGFEGGLSPREGRIECTTEVDTGSVYTSRFGNTITARLSRLAITFITRTAIRSTMISTTLKHYLLRNTLKNTLGVKSGKSGRNGTWSRFARLPSNGIDQKKVESGIDSRQKKEMQTCLTYQKHASNADPSSKQRNSTAASHDFAQISASQHGDETRVSTMNRENALHADKRSTQTSMTRRFVVAAPVRTVTGAGVRDVYDINVDVDHEFIANGIVVHNCIDLTRYALEDDMQGEKKPLQFTM